MKYLKSHRDQKVDPYVSKAIREGCTILEIDLQQACGQIVLGHNWRPKLPFLFDCTLKEYMDRLVESHPNVSVFIQLDIKEICLTNISRTWFARDILKVLWDYRDKIVFLPSANVGLFRPKTMEVIFATLLRSGFSVQRWVDWQAEILAKGSEIIVKDFWK